MKKNKNDPQEVIQLKLIEKKQISHDTFIFSFEIPNNLELGINVCQHIALEANINGEDISRKYTPISSIHMKGKVEVLIKVYFKNEIFFYF